MFHRQRLNVIDVIKHLPLDLSSIVLHQCAIIVKLFRHYVMLVLKKGVSDVGNHYQK